MIKIYISFICLISFFQHGLFGQEVVKAALFGEHANYVKTHEHNVYRIFMDMNGDYYPENIISDKEIETEGDFQLEVWSARFPDKFSDIAKSYKLRETTYSKSNYKTLQDSIIAEISSSINNNTKESQTWLIHGFRKKLYEPEGIYDSTSLFDNIQVRAKIDENLNSPKDNLTIEVYWDGRYDISYRGLKSKINLGKIFKNEAIPNANRCGYSLRQLFALINSQNINIITHSTGTHVAASLLFNKKGNESFNTPHQKLTIVLIASASSGKDLFKNYYNRSSNLNYQAKDNYSLVNFYNEKDNVLRKGGFPKMFGNTTLGCNYRNESKKLKKYFVENFPNSSYVDIPTDENPPGNHFFWIYTNSPEFVNVISLLN